MLGARRLIAGRAERLKDQDQVARIVLPEINAKNPDPYVSATWLAQEFFGVDRSRIRQLVMAGDFPRASIAPRKQTHYWQFSKVLTWLKLWLESGHGIGNFQTRDQVTAVIEAANNEWNRVRVELAQIERDKLLQGPQGTGQGAGR